MMASFGHSISLKSLFIDAVLTDTPEEAKLEIQSHSTAFYFFKISFRENGIV